MKDWNSSVVLNFFLKVFFWDISILEIECSLTITVTHTTTTLKNCSHRKASFLQMGARCQGFSFSAPWHLDKPLELPCFGEADPVVS